ncbi:hypothetical protein FF36_04169 [Frankia torreyi]|uniref:Uncharacterized protein n=1 Tax=Frankia torreyi TaxID=1856 RepID=A0A0D8BB39_9ACTN|nr:MULTISPECIES: hypothetical protein [Frankia]KJE21483.1 hypothetical protein FF36_04169 [Frankia torreyi]KQC38645.1 hypothetical protein UK82_09560 [Frankia sp. ACN1ag]KQM03523.1 hypothetical protein FF86_103950 [Frankia sp. CpI1-P]
MDALRRGWIGLALFFAALILMPILVFGYDKNQPPRHSAVAVTATDRLVTVAPSQPATTPLAFAGIRPGERIFGFRAIRVVSTRYSGPLEFVLNGPIAPFRLDLSQPPYIFNPHVGGWKTTEVPDGEYTLTAIPTQVANDHISITFTVGNGTGATG